MQVNRRYRGFPAVQFTTRRFPPSSTATCRYADVMLTLAWPAASRTSAKVFPPAGAWLINVWRPWWIVSVVRRARPNTLHAVRKRRRSVLWERATRPLIDSQQDDSPLPPPFGSAAGQTHRSHIACIDHSP